MFEESKKNQTVLMLVDDQHIDRRVMDHAHTLAQAGFEVTVLAGELPANPAQRTEKDYPSVRVHRICVPRTETLIAQIDLKRIEEIASELPQYAWPTIFSAFTHFLVEGALLPADIIVANDLSQLPAGVILSKLHNSRLVYDAHELYPDQGFSEQKQQLLTEIERLLIPFADDIFVVNESIGLEMYNRYPCRKPTVLLNSVSLQGRDLPVKSDLIRKSLGIENDKKIVLFQGNLALGVRNLENVVTAMSLISREDIVLVLMGADLSGQARPGLSKLAEDKGVLGSKVLFHEEVPQNELIDYTASADAGIIPYVASGPNNLFCTPNKLFEFIIAGIPIIANDLPELNKFVSSNDFGINISLNSAEDIALAIDQMFSEQYEKFSKSLMNNREKHSWQAQEKVILGLYEKLLSSDQDQALENARVLKSAIADILRNNPESARKEIIKVLANLEGVAGEKNLSQQV